MDYLLLLTVVTIGRLACGNTYESELCYIRRGDDVSTECTLRRETTRCCHGNLSDIRVMVYGKDEKTNCNTTVECGNTNFNCCSRTSQKNISDQDRNGLEKLFNSTNCFKNALDDITMLPFNVGIELVVVSYKCPGNVKGTAITQTTPWIFQAIQHTIEDGGTAATGEDKKASSSNVAAAVAVPVTIVVVGAVVVGTVFYVRRRRSRKDATEQRQEIHTNNAYIGSVSRSMGLYQNAHPSIKAEGQGTNHYYVENADNSVHLIHSSTENNENQLIQPIETTAKNEPPTKSNTTDKDPTGEDEYDHLGNHDTPSSRANNYEHITHINKDDCHSILYDKNQFNQLNTNIFDDEDNYNHVQQNDIADRTETDDSDGAYSHVGGTVGDQRTDDQYSTLESVLDTQDGSRHLNNYFVLEKQY